MQELSLNILDITMNGIAAGADTMRISIEEAYPAMTICIQDNGCGLDEETLDKLRDPFFTSRTTRKVGMGVPLFEMQAEMTGGNLEISSV
ncbi:MAG: sensor histidine kinase, partial [Clostridia bacterium]|nr:sensor histidine kinase [Clostridia bacterium]